MNAAAVQDRDAAALPRALQALETIVLGKPLQVRLCLACLLARGHLLIEDVPGVGKTTLAHALAQVLGLAWQRVQFTSDLLPADILGVSVFDRASCAADRPPLLLMSGIGAHLPFLHRLQQRALRPRARPVDFVRQQELCEEWALPEMELLCGAIENRHADDVRRQQVAGELHPLPGQSEHMGESMRQGRLAYSRDILDQ